MPTQSPTPLCPVCNEPVPLNRSTGRPRKFCSDEHARRFHNDKNRQARGEVKRRGPRVEGPRLTHCRQCGTELAGAQRQFCCKEHGERFWNETRLNGAGEQWHRLSDVDETARVATCSQHGPGTPIAKGARDRFGKGQQWRCALQARESTTVSSREAGWRKRGIADMTYARFEEMLEDQGFACGCCGGAIGTEAHVDHDHRAKLVRGLLCSDCNLGIGKLGDNLTGLRRAIDYLQRNATAAVRP